MQALYRLVARVMNTELAVLVTGESGTAGGTIAVIRICIGAILMWVVIAMIGRSGVSSRATFAARNSPGRKMTVSVPSAW